jgi:hypothetical protein
MSLKVWQYVLAVLSLAALSLNPVQPGGVMAMIFLAWGEPVAAPAPARSHPVESPPALRPVVSYAVKNDVSPALRNMAPILPKARKPREIPLRPLPGRNRSKANDSPPVGRDPVLQAWPGGPNMPAPILNFEGVNNVDGVLPPDTEGDIGPGHYVQWVNVSFAIWAIDRSSNTATRVYGPADGNTLWSGFGGICESNNDGDPIVLYDHLADRWLMSQPAWGFPNNFHQCLAISQTGDPTGAWYRYDFLISTTKMNDYPKFGVWPDAYYLAVNQFDGSTDDWAGQGAIAFERDQMLAGLPAAMVYFDLFGVNPKFGGMLPSDLDGPPPLAGTPNYFVEMDDNAWGWSTDRLSIWEFHVNWSNPAGSTFGRLGLPNVVLDTRPFDTNLCSYGKDCIPQPDVSTEAYLDAISDRLMYRLQYRNFGTYRTLVVNHTVDVDGTDHAGIRWYELRDKGSGWSIEQQGSYAPDRDHRWMGSIAMEGAGNMALGYSISSRTIYPSIRYAGRLAGDPAGTLPQAEETLMAGSGSQTASESRWGDYSMMAVDPTDDCTFWYTQEYYATTSIVDWQTRIGSFKFPVCTSAPTGRLHGTVADAATGTPLSGSTLRAGSYSTFTDAAGYYQFVRLPVGTYNVTAAAYGYAPQTFTIAVTAGDTTTQDFALTALPTVTVSGTVTDGSGHDWPLYARIDIRGYPRGPVFTDPVSGQYSVDLIEGTAYTFNVRAIDDGYNTKARAVTPSAGGSTEDFALPVDAVACTAPGYQFQYVYLEDFETGNGGFTTSGTTSWEWGAPTSGPGNAHSGVNVWATNLSDDYDDDEDGYTISPGIDLSSYAGQVPILTWWQWLQTEHGYDFASVEVSRDDGATWTPVYGEVSGNVDTAWTRHSVALDPTYAVSNFRVRFHFRSDGSVTYPGYYVDDVGISVATPTIAYSEDFEASNGGFITSGTTSWEWGTPTSGPGRAHSGVNVWATNPAGNYGDNEDGYTISPGIDLSSYAGQVPILAWWQWLQTERDYDFASVEVSKDGGATWTVVYGPVSGNVDKAWTWHSVPLDPSYAVSNFRVRFRLQSDGSVTKPGYYVDDVTVEIRAPSGSLPSAPCSPLAGGLVVGNVYDANTGAGLNHATIINDTGDSTATFATRDDPRLDDGFYTLFSPAGSHTFTATLSGGYGSDVQTPMVVLSDTIRQDFNLPAGRLSYTPSSVEVTVALGLSTTVPFTLSNVGILSATFELREVDRGFQPTMSLFQGRGEWLYRSEEGVLMRTNTGNTAMAHPSAYRWTPAQPAALNVLIYADDPVHRAPDTFLDRALQRLGLAYTAHYDEDWTGFETDLTGGTWNLVLVGDDNYSPPASTLTALNSYVLGGGKLVFHSWKVSAYPGHPLWATLGFTFVSDDDDPPDPVYWWDPAHLIFTDPESVPEFTSLTGSIYQIYGQHVNPLPGFQALAGYTTPGPDPNQAALILGNDGHTVFRGFLDGQNDADLDGDTIKDGVELWINLISGIQTGFSADVPWLSEDPMTGTVTPLADQVIAVTFDAGVPEITQPGQYYAQLRIRDNTPYNVTSVPVTMTVNAPATWGKLEGMVTGLSTCDTNPAPLADADVFIESGTGMTWTATTNVSGTYQVWLDEANRPLTITVTHPGYVRQTLTGIIVTAQMTTTQDFALRLDAPCGSRAPSAFDVTVLQGHSTTRLLTLINTGAGDLVFDIQETTRTLGSDLLFPQPQVQGHTTVVHEDKKTHREVMPGRSVRLAGGGPDPFGYTYKDSGEPGGPGYGWIEIAPPAGGTGTEITGLTGEDDSYYWPLALPFAFNFYGTDYTTLAVASNGTLYFEDNYLGLENVPIPGPNDYGVERFIAHLWDDLVVRPGAVYYKAEANRIVIEYYQVSGFESPDWGTWEVILFDNGSILFQYQDVTFGNFRDYGGAATVGIQGNTTTGLQYSYNTAALSAGLAICFAYPGQLPDCATYGDVPWLSERPITGTVPAGSVLPVNVTFDATRLPVGLYTATLVIRTNDPGARTFRVPVAMTVRPVLHKMFLPLIRK